MSRTRSIRDGIRESGGSLSPELDALADRAGRLRPSHRDPERFLVEKDEIERALRRLAPRQVAG